MSVQFPPCPPQYKNIQHYLKVASEHDQRDPIVSYWCRLYALQQAMKIDKKSEDCVKLLLSLMDWLEKVKTSQKDNESITNDIAAQAYLENYALKLFLWADGQDRAAIFNKNVVKAFYTAGMLFDVMDTFGEPSESLGQNKKYAKWKASYIHTCLKNGETPIPGPMGGEDEEGEFGAVGGQEQPQGGHMGFVQPGFPEFSGASGFNPNSGEQFPGYNPPPSAAPTPTDVLPSTPSSAPTVPPTFAPQQPAQPFQPPAQPFQPPAPAVIPPSSSAMTSSGATLSPEQLTKAQKYCKWASSSLNYDDVPTAILNLQKALYLLQTGQDS